MNRQGNRRTTKEGSSDLKFQNLCLPKNRSWPRMSSITGQFQAMDQPLPERERNFAVAVLHGPKDHRDGDYEDPELHVGEVCQSIQILPARPIKESEYADTRYFKGVMDTPHGLDTETSVPMDHHPWQTEMGLEKSSLIHPPLHVDKATSKDPRSQHVKGDRPTKGNKTPAPPPRPLATLPKKYQPLPPKPESSWSPHPQRLSLPDVQKGSSFMARETGRQQQPTTDHQTHEVMSSELERQISLKDLSEVLGRERVPHYQMKPESIHLSRHQSTPEIPLAIASSPFTTRNHSVQNRDHKEGMQLHPPQRCQSPARFSPQENLLHYKNTSWRKPFTTRSDEKDVQWNDWYIGEHSRQAVEEALRKENKDGTFLVRDCSTKSRAEPYVLVVFYGNKVYNVKIRFLEKNQQFALGTGLRGDEKFNSVEDIIEHYKYFPIILIDGKDKTGIHREQCYLTRPLPLARCFPSW